jgi:hypothetical protein
MLLQSLEGSDEMEWGDGAERRRSFFTSKFERGMISSSRQASSSCGLCLDAAVWHALPLHTEQGALLRAECIGRAIELERSLSKGMFGFVQRADPRQCYSAAAAGSAILSCFS